MSKRIRELRLHVENKIADHERKRDALMRQRDDLVNAETLENFLATKALAKVEPQSMGLDYGTDDQSVECVVHAGGWLGVFARLGSTSQATQ
jgi:hypothetical protein